MIIWQGAPSRAADRSLFQKRGSATANGTPSRTQFTSRQRRRFASRILPGLAEFFSIEASFVLFVFAGRFKMLPELRGLPVDFTLLFFVVTFCLIVWAIVSGRVKPAPLSLPVVLMILFSEVAAASLFWSSLDPLNTDKALRFLLLTSTSFFGACVIGQDRGRRRRLMRMLAWFSSVILLYYAYYRYVLSVEVGDGELLNTGRYPPDANNYLEYGSHASILFIIFLAVAAFGSPKQLCSVVFGSGIMLFALMTIGGRGPLVLALLAVPLLALGLLGRSARALRRLSRVAALICGLIVLAAVGYVALEHLDGSGAASEQHFRTLDRYQAQLSQEDTSSMDERYEGQDFAFRMWLEKPILGWGIGEFRVKDSYLKYPHNLPLEILAETGIVGAFLFFGICTIAACDCLRIAGNRTCDWTDATIVLLFLTELASHLTVQGYLADDRIFLAYMGLVIGSRAVRPPPHFREC